MHYVSIYPYYYFNHVDFILTLSNMILIGQIVDSPVGNSNWEFEIRVTVYDFLLQNEDKMGNNSRHQFTSNTNTFITR